MVRLSVRKSPVTQIASRGPAEEDADNRQRLGSRADSDATGYGKDPIKGMPSLGALGGGPQKIGFGGSGGGGLADKVEAFNQNKQPPAGLEMPSGLADALPPSDSDSFEDRFNTFLAGGGGGGLGSGIDNDRFVDRAGYTGVGGGSDTRPPPRQRGERPPEEEGGGSEWNADDYLDPQSAAWLRDLLNPTDTSEREALAREEQEKARARSRADMDARAGMGGLGLSGGQIALGNQMQRESASALADQILGIKEGARKEDFQRGSFATQLIDRGTQRGQDDEMMAAIMKAIGVGDDDGDGAEPGEDDPLKDRQGEGKNPLDAKWRQEAQAHYDSLPFAQQAAYTTLAGTIGAILGFGAGGLVTAAFGADLAYWAHQNGMSIDDIKNWLARDPGNAAQLVEEVEGSK